MSKKFTDGKWEVWRDGSIHSGNELVTIDERSDKSMANARLVAAAPDMYRLLEEMCPYVSAYMAEQIRRLLLKIDGETEPTIYTIPLSNGSTRNYTLEDLQALIIEHKNMQELLREVREACIADTKAFAMREKASYKIQNFLCRIHYSREA